MTTTTIDQSAAQLAGHQGFSIISNETLLQLYLSMMKGRMLEERLRVLAGREAAAVGVLAGLLPEDALAASPDNLIVRFLWNEILGKPLDELLAQKAGLDFATQFKAAMEIKRAQKTAGNARISVVFLESDSGLPEEAIQRAKAKKLPILFVRPTSALSEANPAQQSGIPTMPVDGADVVAVYRVATESITHARKGNGPTLIECFFDPAESQDPLQKMEAYLTRKGLFRAAWKKEAVTGFRRDLEAAIPATRH